MAAAAASFAQAVRSNGWHVRVPSDEQLADASSPCDRLPTNGDDGGMGGNGEVDEASAHSSQPFPTTMWSDRH